MSQFVVTTNQLLHSEIQVQTGSITYNVKIGQQILNNIGQWIQEAQPKFHPTQIVTITDTNIYSLYKSDIENVMLNTLNIKDTDIKLINLEYETFSKIESKNIYSHLIIVIPYGEHSKSREMKHIIENYLITYNCTKTTLFLAFGGGVVGDLTGYIASTYYRGCRMVQIPTTLLAMVDASIGGKTAVNVFPYGKNLIGSFHQPILVIIDTMFLYTLERRLLAEGMAEIIKIGLISDITTFKLCEDLGVKFNHGSAIIGEALIHLINICVKFKAHVVSQDEKDVGLRNILNFGHTIGHAIEAQLNNHWLHGECVSIGIVYELMASRALGLTDEHLPDKAETCLSLYGLPTRLYSKNPSCYSDFDVDEIIAALMHDKKTDNHTPKIVVVSSIGRLGNPFMEDIPIHLLKRLLSPAVQIKAARNVMGRVKLPGSKSIANRALLLASLGKGLCTLHNLPSSEDVGIMKCIMQQQLNVPIEDIADSFGSITVSGLNITQNKECNTSNKNNVIYTEGILRIWVENAGTVSRFLAPIGALLLALSDPLTGIKAVEISGNQHMQRRPIGDLMDTLQQAFPGLSIKYLGKFPRCLPLSITINHDIIPAFPGGRLRVKNKLSSQFVSAMLMIGIYTNNRPLELELKDFDVSSDGTRRVVSQPYIDMTISMMKTWGVPVECNRLGLYKIPRIGCYKNPSTYLIEADASAASYPLAIAAVTHGQVAVNIKAPEPGRANALQGDTNFLSVLEKTGCTINKDENGWITLQGPEHLTSFGTIDMNTMTDTFMTAAVVAACCSPLGNNDNVNEDKMDSCIMGVANQRVKECNRIEATVDNLCRCNFHVEEHEDGLTIFGNQHSKQSITNSNIQYPRLNNTPTTTIIIDPRSDHRQAMSFAVLGAALGNIVIPQWRCVEKTFPNFWDMCERDLHLTVEGVNLHARKPQLQTFSKDSLQNLHIVALIGMRNVGKTKYGKLSAGILNWNFVDLDEALNINITEFVAKHGWELFRQKETQKLQEILANVRTNHTASTIISCGGGIVESFINVKILLQSNVKIVWLRRNDWITNQNVPQQEEYCDSEQKPPFCNETDEEVYEWRYALYEQMSQYEYFITTPSSTIFDTLQENSSTAHSIIALGLSHLIESITKTVHDLTPRLLGSQFLSLTEPTYLTKTESDIKQLTKDVDALEIRADLLDDIHMLSVELSRIRCLTSKLIVLTYRSISEGGYGTYCNHNFINICKTQQHFHNLKEISFEEFLNIGVRSGVDFIDIEVSELERSNNAQYLLKSQASLTSTRYIFSKHLPLQHVPYETYLIEKQINELALWCRKNGEGDIIKIVYGPTKSLENQNFNNEDDSLRLHYVVRQMENKLNIPIIALILSHRGVLSRILNSGWTPVTHPNLKMSGSDGQLSAAEVLSRRISCGLPCFNFFLFGYPIDESLSPLLHTSLFEMAGISTASYKKYPTLTCKPLQYLIHQAAFTGGSITIPLKEEMYKLAIENPEYFLIHPSAMRAKSVNTVVREGFSTFICLNTDICALEKVLREQQKTISQSLLVLGAGGTACSALTAIELVNPNASIYIWNRSKEKGLYLQERFPKIKNVYSENDNVSHLDVDTIISTIPGTALLPPGLIQTLARSSTAKEPLRLINLAYWPRKETYFDLTDNASSLNTMKTKTICLKNNNSTTFAAQAQACNLSMLPGIDLLIWQGLEQFKWFRATATNNPKRINDFPISAVEYKDNENLKKIYNHIIDVYKKSNLNKT